MRLTNLKSLVITISACLTLISCQNVDPPTPVLPIPTKTQLAWHEMERNAFIHFGLNTFTDQEWGYGDVSAATFNPSDLDANQWCEVIKNAGLKGIILTAKHHDGFCLWPSKYTEYSVKNSPWRDGKGDLVREVSDACKKYGLKFGIYLSPWDRNHELYGTDEYIKYFRDQLTELLTNYGDIFEVWFDGANGGTGYYSGADEKRSVDRKTYYDWKTTNSLVKELQPNALIFSDGGPDIRWCGNEHGVAGRTNWCTLRRDEVWPGWDRYRELNPGHEDGDYWVPAEINVSVRPGWFYHRSEDHKVKSVSLLVDYFYQSVGRNGTGLLNFPIDERGLVHPVDSSNVLAWQKIIESDLSENLLTEAEIFASNIRGKSSEYEADNVNDSDPKSYWATDDTVTAAQLIINRKEPIFFNRFLIQEYITLGQRTQQFALEIINEDGTWEKLAEETTIGYKRILRFPTVSSSKIRLSITKSKASPVISNIELYNAPKLIITPEIRRNKEGDVSILIPDKEVEVFYTKDGSNPDAQSFIYESPFQFHQKGVIKAVAIDKSSKRQSETASKEFDVGKKKWKIINSKDGRNKLMFDGDPSTVWHNDKKHSSDLKIDFGVVLSLTGFKYLPDQNRYAKGIISNYELLISLDRKRWNSVISGEFSNIKNNPILQEVGFKTVKGRYLKLKSLNTIDGGNLIGYAEFDIVTELK